MTSLIPEMKESLGDLQGFADEAISLLQAGSIPLRLWKRDAGIWTADPLQQQAIRNRLGWLDVASSMLNACDEINEFVNGIRADGFTHAVLLGMGGSSLASEVLRGSFGVAKGFLDLSVLDSTDPSAVRGVEHMIPIEKTLFIVATKSGTTTETVSLFSYFYEKMVSVKGTAAGRSFVAITDPGTSLISSAVQKGFRRVFLNPPDIGGRFSALSYFGLIPAALIGIDVQRFLESAKEMQERCAPSVPSAGNPGMRLGALLAAAHRAGRDKITFVLGNEIRKLGLWLEQLIAESTGKEGRGLVPVAGEPEGKIGVYGDDRFFVSISAGLQLDGTQDRELRSLKTAGHPVLRIHLEDLYDIAAEFYRWEMATAAAGALLGVNPFDEPNVKESKDMTRQVLSVFQETGTFPTEHPRVDCGPLRLFADDATVSELLRVPPSRFPGVTCAGLLNAHLRRVGPGDYIALLAFLPPSNEADRLLGSMREELRDRLCAATTFGYGPRYLHSTGQLHKGGPDIGLFVLITAENAEEIPVPDTGYTFGTLILAQALGDLQVLRNRGRRVIRVDLGVNVIDGLELLSSIVRNVLAS